MKKKTNLNQFEIKAIIDKCDVCYLGMSNENLPYVLPFNFAFVDNAIYLHSAPQGKKINILKKNNRVSVAFSTDHSLVFQSESVACSFSMKFRSVVADGTLHFVDDYDEKVKMMNFIMQKYTGREFAFNAPAIKNVTIMKVVIEKITGKEFGY